MHDLSYLKKPLRYPELLQPSKLYKFFRFIESQDQILCCRFDTIPDNNNSKDTESCCFLSIHFIDHNMKLLDLFTGEFHLKRGVYENVIKLISNEYFKIQKDILEDIKKKELSIVFTKHFCFGNKGIFHTFSNVIINDYYDYGKFLDYDLLVDYTRALLVETMFSSLKTNLTLGTFESNIQSILNLKRPEIKLGFPIDRKGDIRLSISQLENLYTELLEDPIAFKLKYA